MEAPFDPLQAGQFIEDIVVRIYRKLRDWLLQFQWEAVMEVAKGVNGLIIILSTESGKSLIFILPMMLFNTKRTLLITALHIVVNNMLTRCHNANIDSCIYSRQQQL
jgi:superfamily II DNA helicase RecQ